MLRQDRLKCLIDERTLTRTRHTSDDDKVAKWEADIHVFKVITRTSYQLDILTVTLSPFLWNFNDTFSVQILGCKCVCLQHV